MFQGWGGAGNSNVEAKGLRHSVCKISLNQAGKNLINVHFCCQGQTAFCLLCLPSEMPMKKFCMVRGRNHYHLIPNI